MKPRNPKRPKPRKKRCNSGKCCVSDCQGEDDWGITYHAFPKSGKKMVMENSHGRRLICDRRKIWEDRVGFDTEITKNSKVCSLHFSLEDYCREVKRRRLKASAVPSLNLPEESSGFITFEERFKPVGNQKTDKKNTSAIKKSTESNLLSEEKESLISSTSANESIVMESSDECEEISIDVISYNSDEENDKENLKPEETIIQELNIQVQLSEDAKEIFEYEETKVEVDVEESLSESKKEICKSEYTNEIEMIEEVDEDVKIEIEENKNFILQTERKLEILDMLLTTFELSKLMPGAFY